MISANHIDFNNLEKKLYKIGCEYDKNLMMKVLIQMDKVISLSRDRKKYRHKGKIKTTIKTLMGEVEFERAVYKTKEENVEPQHIYLLDKIINLGHL